MTYKELLTTDEGVQIYARIDDDGLCRLSCTGEYAPFVAWLAEGNEPLPADDP